MTLVQAALLGLVQGLTEFLPVSSSGHLVIFQHILGFSQPPVAFDVLLHIATLITIIIVFFKELKSLTKNYLQAIILASIPTAIIGLLLSGKMEELFNSLRLTAFAFLVTSTLLFSTLRLQRSKNNKTLISSFSALIVGITQGIAVIPGISRSGSTIVAGLWTGLDRKTAVAFSFLLSIPAIIGAQILEIAKPGDDQLQFSIYVIGFLTAFFSGWLSLRALKKLVETSKLHYFALYTLILALYLLFS